MDDVYEIYFWNLTPEARINLLNAFDIEEPSDMNWDIYPIATIPYGEE